MYMTPYKWAQFTYLGYPGLSKMLDNLYLTMTL